MKRKAVLAIMLTLLLVGMLTLAFNIQPVKSGWTWTETIYIRADGSVDPDTAPISTVDNINYTLTDNIVGDVPEDSSAIVVERDNIVIDGTGYTLQGTRSLGSRGIYLSGRNNVTIKNMEIKAFKEGIRFYNSSSNSIYGNNITNNGIGIRLEESCNNRIFANTVTNTGCGVAIGWDSRNNAVSGNAITNGTMGIALDEYPNTVCGNNITNCSGRAIWLGIVMDNKFCHNNFINNTTPQVFFQGYWAGNNTWDDGYPSGGNFWSDYTGNDIYSGPYQDVPGSDGIGDIPYIVDHDPYLNIDHYPFMNPWTPPDVAIVNVTTSKTVVGQGFATHINVTVEKQGTITETFNVTAHADLNTTVVGDEITIGTQNVTLTGVNSTTITFTWNTTGVEKGDYTISAKASVLPGETDTTDNTKVDGTITVLSPGHDVTIKDVTPSKTVVGQNYSLSIDVTAKNYGNFTEAFNITAYYNSNAINFVTVFSLPPAEETTVTFLWNTTGVAKGNYTISANATIVPGETDTEDNTLTNGEVTVACLGDLTGPTPNVPDGTVNMRDISLVAKGFGANLVTDPASPRYGQYWHPTPCATCPHSANCDLTGPTPGLPDGTTNMRDIALVASLFGTGGC